MSKKEPYDIPETVEDAVETMLKFTNEKDCKIIASMKRDDLNLLHHGFGTCIRNNFKMWKAGSKLVQSCAERDSSIKGKSQYVHPDDASDVIIVAFWEKLNEGNRDLPN